MSFFYTVNEVMDSVTITLMLFSHSKRKKERKNNPTTQLGCLLSVWYIWIFKFSSSDDDDAMVRQHSGAKVTVMRLSLKLPSRWTLKPVVAPDHQIKMHWSEVWCDSFSGIGNLCECTEESQLISIEGQQKWMAQGCIKNGTISHLSVPI